MLNVAVINAGRLKDAFRALVNALEETDKIKLSFSSDECFLGLTKEVLVQSFFTAQSVNADKSVEVNANELKTVLSTYRSKKQTIEVSIEDEDLVFISNDKRQTLKIVDQSEPKNNKQKHYLLGSLNPLDLKCLLKINRPSSAMKILNGLNEDLFVTNVDGFLSLGVYSYSNAECLYFNLYGKNNYKNFSVFIARDRLALLKKILKDMFETIEISKVGKFLELKSGNLIIYLSVSKTASEIKPAKFNNVEWKKINTEEDKQRLLSDANITIKSANERDRILNRVLSVTDGAEELNVVSMERISIFKFTRYYGDMFLLEKRGDF